ncbi:MAG: response regulator [Archangium sp.]
MLNLLVVDDDSIDVMTLKRGLERAGIEYVLNEAFDGVSALEALRSGKFPLERLLVVLDLNMPRMNGLEFLRALRTDSVLGSTRVLVLTTSTQETDRAEAARLHVAGYFVKPLDFAPFVELLKTIDRYWAASLF